MIEIINLHKYYKSKSEKLHALKNINLIFEDTGFVVLTGKSGSGKSTLLNLLGGLDQYDDGQIRIKNQETKSFNRNSWDSYRNTYVGFVFQEFYLINDLTIGQNIALALELQGYPNDQIDSRVKEILDQVELLDYQNRMPNEISGGQKQRIAIARALIKNPHIILADEPTGNLDSETGTLILELLKKLSKTKLVIMVTHDQEFAHHYGDRIIELKDGEVISDYKKDHQSDKTLTYDSSGHVKQVIKLTKGKKLSGSTINEINQLLMNSNEKLYLSLDQRTEFQNVMSSEPFHVEKNNINNQEVLYLKKTKLPFRYAYKMALNSLFKKKLKLLTMMFLVTFSLIFMGMATNLSLYDTSKAANLTFEKANEPILPLLKEYNLCQPDNSNCKSNKTSDSYNQEDIDYWNLTYPGIKIITTYHKFFRTNIIPSDTPDSYYYGIARQAFSYVTIIDENKTAFNLLSGDYPKEDEIAITDYMADMFLHYHSFENATNYDELIGQEIEMDFYDVKIAGIIETNIRMFDKYKTSNDTPGEFNFNTSDYLQVYMTKQMYKQLTAITDFSIDVIKGDSEDYFSGKGSSTLNPEYNDYLVGRLPIQADEIVVDHRALTELGFEYDPSIQDDVSQYLNQTVTLDFFGDYQQSYKIVGIIDYENEDGIFMPFSIMHTEGEYESIKNLCYRKQANAVLGDDSEENIEFLTKLHDMGYYHNTFYSKEIYSLHNIIDQLRILFYVLGGVFIVFGAVLMFTFMVFSISDKQREIGTLRAIGAKGLDIGKIFITESLLIGLASSMIASIGVLIFTRILNHVLINELELKVVILYNNVYASLLVIGIALLMAVTSTYIPIKRITSMKPIHAIKGIK